VLPGAYLSRATEDGALPGAEHVRVALVDEEPRCVDAAWRIRRVAEALMGD
jgi:hypothetical protein